MTYLSLLLGEGVSVFFHLFKKSMYKYVLEKINVNVKVGPKNTKIKDTNCN